MILNFGLKGCYNEGIKENDKFPFLIFFIKNIIPESSQNSKSTQKFFK